MGKIASPSKTEQPKEAASKTNGKDVAETPKPREQAPARDRSADAKELEKIRKELASLVEGEVRFREEPEFNAKKEKLLRVNGDTVAYVSILENGEYRALRSKYDLSEKGRDPKEIAEAIQKAASLPRKAPKTPKAKGNGKGREKTSQTA